jgi:hypothetical protein
MNWLRDLLMPKREEPKTVHEVARGSNLDLILRGTNGAINKLADAIGGGLQAIALALSTPHDNSVEVKRLTAQLKEQNDALQSAIDQASR